MNFDDMPELHWAVGYPFALSMMVLTCVSLYTIFKRRGWLVAVPAVGQRRR